jgi:peptidoglycan/xylan/chitin deacetylase (PgdA/CDA1 family)
MSESMNESSSAVRRWRPSPLLAASAVAHVAGAGLLIARPRLWPWALGGLVLNHALLTAAGLWPRSQWLGPNWVRLPAAAAQRRQVAITIDDGPDPEVTPPLLDILDRHSARASFFCIGERVAAYPQLAREIVARGHAIENHSLRHLHRFSVLGVAGMRAEVQRAQQQIVDVTGATPRFFRAPAGLRNPFLDPVLAQLGLMLASWTRRGFDTRTGQPDVVAARLLRGLAAGDILLLHDGHAARSPDGVAVAVQVLPRLLDSLRVAALTPVTLQSALC